MPPKTPRPQSKKLGTKGRASNVSLDEKKVMVTLYETLGTYEAVAHAVGRTAATVMNNIKKFKATKSFERAKTSGRPRKTSRTDDIKLMIDMQKNRDITAEQLLKENPEIIVCPETVRRRLKESGEFNSYWKVKKPFINKKNRRKRVEWCRAHRGWTKQQWARVLWSDESPYVLFFNRKTRVWRRHNERYKRFATKATVKHDVKINVWGCFASHGVGKLYEVQGILDKRQYKEILINQMMPSAERLFDTQDWYFQQDNDPKHTAKTTKTWFRRNRTPLLDWPAQSPDLNPIENLWSYLDYKLKDRKPKNKAELFQILQEAWNAIPIDLLMKLSDSMPDRIEAVLKAKGYASKY